MFQPETRVIVSTETKTDIEAEIARQIRTIQSYNWKLNNGVGVPETNTANILKALEVIRQLKEEGTISQGLEAKVEDWKQRFVHLAPQQTTAA